ncbi:MAG: co-chaperone DjlA, partial [Porticoccaceae bacterium]|nr:co-chaperone DjlA [Porticoccaceae bacterium]MBT7565296.1 co-chaperone DjlA [Porticoccaceae bacterium]
MLGKLIAGSLGFMVAGPFGAVLGLYVGHQFDRGVGGFSRPVSAADQARIRAAFFETVFSLLGNVAKADGRVSS